MNPDEMLRSRKKVIKGEGLASLEKGETKFKDVQRITGCAAKCGKHKDDIRRLIKQHRREDE